MRRVLLSLFLCFSIAPCLWADGQPGQQQSQKLDVQVRVQLDYLLYLPKDYDKQEKWPLMLFLHGAGERGDDIEQVKVHGPPKLIAAGKEFPFIVVSPQCPKGLWWEPSQLLALLDEIETMYKVDKERVYLTGLSMGGFGTWNLAQVAPTRFAALVPICGGGQPRRTKRFSHIAVWAFHGVKDDAVLLSETAVMIEALRKNGADPKLTVYSDAAHDSWTQAYDTPELYEWLLKQTRQPAKPEE